MHAGGRVLEMLGFGGLMLLLASVAKWGLWMEDLGRGKLGTARWRED